MEGHSGQPQAIARLTQAASASWAATNQSGIGRGLFDMDTLNAIHESMHRAVQAVGGRIDAGLRPPARGRFELYLPQAATGNV